MKKSLIKITTISAVFVLGLGISLNIQRQPIAVEATQHIGNYDDYHYTGNYYDSLNTSGTDGLNGTFQSALATYVFPKAWYTYSGNSAGTLGQELQKADEDPTNSANMVLLYTRDSIKKTAATVDGVMQWNREHVWPQANSNDCWGTDKAGTDLLHLRPTYEKTNSTRGNLRYGYVSGNPSALTYNDMTYGYSGGGFFEPLDSVKGDVARIIMYIYTTYNAYYNNKLSVTGAFASYDTLLKWHIADKPDAMEGYRNDYVEKSSNQKNRNPFVDRPEYAWRIFGDSASASVKNDCIAAYPGDGSWTQGSSSSSNPAQSSTPVSSSTPISSSNTSIAGQYSVTFASNGDDGSAELKSDAIYSAQLSSNTLIKSVNSATKVFAGKSGLKLGSSSASGEIKFILKDEANSNIESVEIESTKYGSDSGKLVVKFDSTTVSSDINPGTTFQKSLNKESISTVTISTSSKRAYLNKITVNVASSSPSSSSEPISSSEAPVSSETPVSSEVISSSEPIQSNPESSCIDTNSSVVNSEPSSEVISSEATTSVVESSETPVITSQIEETTSAATPTTIVEPEQPAPEQPAPEQPEEKGCNGSVVASLSVVSVGALMGLVFAFSKRKH